ncbi:MAG: hypothetical protein M3Y13_15690, partial [Armatimonadota bacterium]|nr:hypothetical protein [Armatimonadota bacterium]
QWVQTYQQDLIFTAGDDCRDWLVSVHALPKDARRYGSVDLYEIRCRLASPWSNGVARTETLAETCRMILEGLKQT